MVVTLARTFGDVAHAVHATTNLISMFGVGPRSIFEIQLKWICGFHAIGAAMQPESPVRRYFQAFNLNEHWDLFDLMLRSLGLVDGNANIQLDIIRLLLVHERQHAVEYLMAVILFAGGEGKI